MTSAAPAGPATVTGVEHLVAAIDVGGTSMKAALVDAGGTVAHTVRRPTPYGADGVLTTLAEVVAELEAHAGQAVAAVGVVVPGLVDDAGGVALFSANLGWRDLPLPERLSAITGRPVVLGHDVRAGALAEQRLGAARGHDDVAFIPIGTGIAAAFVSDGKILVAGGYAGEIGHLVVEPDGQPCGCGNRGCLETIASARALARRYRELTGAEEVTTALAVAERMRAGDGVAARVWAEGVDALSGALAAVVTVLAPEVVVIGGGLSGAGEDLLAPLRERLAARLTFQRVPELTTSALGDQAGCLGAALLALDHVRSAT